jgi:hypothetical protein
MTSQTQILASQSEGANAGALMDEMNTRKQLAIAQEQAAAAQLAAQTAIRQSVINANEVAIMRKQFENADRPWIDVDVSISSPLIYDSGEVRVEFTFVPKNIGRSPAQNISIDPRLKPILMGDDLREIQRHLCENSAANDKNATLKYTLFPGDRYIQRMEIGMSIEDVNSRFSRTEFERSLGPLDPIPIGLVGCVDYTYESSPRHHQTGFALDVLMKDGRLPLKSMTPLAPESLMLRLHPVGGHFAN